MEPITCDEIFMATAAGEYSGELPEPVTRSGNRYGLLNRHNVDAATHIERWSRPALLKGLIKGSGQTIDWIENISV